MKTNRRILLASAFLAMTCTLASASQINGTCSTAGPGPTELGVATSGLVTCTQFNLNPAWLTSIVITLQGNVVNNSSITLTNTNADSATATASTDVAFNLSAALAGFTFVTDGQGNLFDVFASTGAQTIPGLGTVGPILVTGSGSNASTDTTAGTFGAYEGAGTFSINDRTTTNLVSNFNGGNGTVSQVTKATGTATVVYNYTVPSATPEPTTMVLFGSALVGLGFIRKRVRQ
jgi:hypothetical protein